MDHPYTVQKLNRNLSAVLKDGEVVVFLKPSRVKQWLAVKVRAEADHAVYAAEQRARRVRRAQEYLARRAARPKQERFGF